MLTIFTRKLIVGSEGITNWNILVVLNCDYCFYFNKEKKTIVIYYISNDYNSTQPVTCSNSTIQTAEQGVKSILSQQQKTDVAVLVYSVLALNRFHVLL